MVDVTREDFGDVADRPVPGVREFVAETPVSVYLGMFRAFIDRLFDAPFKPPGFPVQHLGIFVLEVVAGLCYVLVHR